MPTYRQAGIADDSLDGPRVTKLADIFVSYTKSDRAVAHWLATELRSLHHTPHLHEKEVKGGDNFIRWMMERLGTVDHALCVISKEYLLAPYSMAELHAALKKAIEKGSNFVLPVVVKPCDVPPLIDSLSRCDLFEGPDDEKRARFRDFMGRSAAPARTPPEGVVASNIPIRVPVHFMGREEALADIEAAMEGHHGRVAITALHGLRGVGKTVLAAAYAERHRGDYRATWWLRAETAAGMRADLVGLGVRLGWVGADDKEEPALAAVSERLGHEGDGILLIFDNAVDADSLAPYLPRGGAARVLVTSNYHAWRGTAEPFEILLWPKETGADYLIARTGRDTEREAAEDLSVALGGLPLAHEQAAAYCERLEISLAEYARRFAAEPARYLDTDKDAPADYHDKTTVAKTFALAIDAASKLHPAAEPLIVHAALLAPEPIPLFLFIEGREKFGEPLASLLAADGLDEAVAALRAFALVDRDTIPDERDPEIKTDTIRLHRLVREVAAARCTRDAQEDVRRALITAMAEVYPPDLQGAPNAWPRARRINALALDLVGGNTVPLTGSELAVGYLMSQLGGYQYGALAAYAGALPFYERALAIYDRVLDPEHPFTISALDNVALLLHERGDLTVARPLLERALTTREKISGPEHPETARSLNNLAMLLQAQGELAAARPLFERALAIREKVFGTDHPDIAPSLNNLAGLRYTLHDLAGARPLLERALEIYEKALGSEHPYAAISLDNLASVIQDQGDLAAARSLFERALSIREKVFGPEHPSTVNTRRALALLTARGG